MAAAPAGEDSNAAVACGSPPCSMRDFDPSGLGHLGRDEVSALLGEVLAVDWGGGAWGDARSRAALRRRFEALNTASCGAALSGTPGAPLDREPGSLARRVRAALPRLHDRALRRDLEEALGALERGCVPHRSGVPDKD
ncbi:MAG: hypothetical protein ICV73_09405 [Acetobacteraceae bacterium]|nr:hypothetical protein [Acetobacteraceae bacterium]